MADLPEEAARRIHFYRMHAGLEANGRRTPFDIVPSLRTINKLPFADPGRYMDNGDGNTTCAWIDSGKLPRMRLATIRKTDLPQFENAGRLADLNLPVDGGLVEAMHLVFFADNVVGAEFNFYGPRASRLRDYLRHVAPVESQNLTKVRSLGRGDILAQLKRLDSIRLLTIRASPSYAEILAEEDTDLGSIMTAAANVDGAEQVAISISVAPRSRDTHLATKVFDAIKRLAKKGKINEELVSKFEVRGFSEDLHRLDTVDLLKDFLVSDQKVTKVTARSRGLVSATVYQAIEDAYSEMKDQINKAIDL